MAPATPDERGVARRQKTRVGLVSGGLGAYWLQFPELRPRLEAHTEEVVRRLRAGGTEVLATDFISDPHDSLRAAKQLSAWQCDLVIINLPTYLTSSMVVPIAQRVPAPLLLLSLQPSAAMDHAAFDYGAVAGVLRGMPASRGQERARPLWLRAPIRVGSSPQR